jgi:uncharacterized protein
MRKSSGYGTRTTGRIGGGVLRVFGGLWWIGILHGINFRPTGGWPGGVVPIAAHIGYHHAAVQNWRNAEHPRPRNAEKGDDMEEHIPLSGPIDLGALDDYLMSDHAPDDSMGLSDLDGFLTGIVVGPELILPSEWLPLIWGGKDPEFENEAEMRIVLGTIMGRYNEIITCLDSEPGNFEPIFLEGPEDEVIASDWAAGFLDAVALRPKAWEPLITHDRAGIMIMPILMLNGDAELDLGLEGGAVDEDAFMAEVPDIIPACVAGIHEFWRNNATHRKSRSNRGRSSHNRRTRH